MAPASASDCTGTAMFEFVPDHITAHFGSDGLAVQLGALWRYGSVLLVVISGAPEFRKEWNSMQG
jgi:hypothetical protein